MLLQLRYVNAQRIPAASFRAPGRVHGTTYTLLCKAGKFDAEKFAATSKVLLDEFASRNLPVSWPPSSAEQTELCRCSPDTAAANLRGLFATLPYDPSLISRMVAKAPYVFLRGRPESLRAKVVALAQLLGMAEAEAFERFANTAPKVFNRSAEAIAEFVAALEELMLEHGGGIDSREVVIGFPKVLEQSPETMADKYRRIEAAARGCERWRGEWEREMTAGRFGNVLSCGMPKVQRLEFCVQNRWFPECSMATLLRQPEAAWAKRLAGGAGALAAGQQAAQAAQQAEAGQAKARLPVRQAGRQSQAAPADQGQQPQQPQQELALQEPQQGQPALPAPPRRGSGPRKATVLARQQRREASEAAAGVADQTEEATQTGKKKGGKKWGITAEALAAAGILATGEQAAGAAGPAAAAAGTPAAPAPEPEAAAVGTPAAEPRARRRSVGSGASGAAKAGRKAASL